MIRSRLSVAMCTYNGALYLGDQLSSLACQTRTPDELVVVDDGSIDESIRIIENFAGEAPFPVRLYVNESRLGPTANFGKAVELCDGDIIFLCDQDNVWRSDRLGRMTAEFSKSERVVAVFTDAEVVDEHLASLGPSLFERLKFSSNEREQFASGGGFEVLLRHYVVWGCTLAFRSTLKKLVLPIPTAWPHDAWIALLATSSSDVVPIAEASMLFRQHGGQQTVLRMGIIERWRRLRSAHGIEQREAVVRYELVAVRMLERSAPEEVESKLGALDAKIEHLSARQEMRGLVRRLRFLLRELCNGRYRRYSKGWKEIVKDLLF